jgi:hypothetical protein
MQESIQQPHPSRDEIAALAYQMWEKNGKPAGQDIKFWLQAEESLRSPVKSQPQAAAPLPRAVPPPPPPMPASPKSPGIRAKKASSKPTKKGGLTL